MDYKDFYNKLNEIKIISPISELILEFIGSKIDVPKKNEVLCLLSLYFVFANSGNMCMSLDKELLMQKIDKKLNEVRIMMEEKEEDATSSLDEIKNECIKLINEDLDLINKDYLSSIIGCIDNNKLFFIEDKWLYSRAYYNSRKVIIESIKDLFKKNPLVKPTLDISKYYKEKFSLSKGQEEVINKGYSNNLLVTGGPGTGKTTSVLFLLLSLIEANKDYNIYITAPSGKAASRMKESIIKNLDSSLKENFKVEHKDIYDIVTSLEGNTIHRLLGFNGRFKYNKDNKFDDKSIFVIDEASMIDATIFSALLEAIPSNARVFILGDKNQLPSVECGAIFGDLLEIDKLKDNIVEIDESKRFSEGSTIDTLAKQINNGEAVSADWKDYTKFEVVDVKEDSEGKVQEYQVKYYNDEAKDEKAMIKDIANKWADAFLTKLKTECNNIDCTDIKVLDKLYNYIEESKILCLVKDSKRGVVEVNKIIREHCYTDKDKTLYGYHCGEILMINKNDYQLDLYNGDTGILIRPKDDDMLYLMFKKTTNNGISENFESNKIFKVGDYIFYPIRMISSDEVELAYAITIHKSQGSDYKSILVILSNAQGHPLLNRNALYTGITRTKGNTYILSNNDRFNEAIKNVISRDTNIKSGIE